MKTILINGGPRKNWSTHQLLMEAEHGAKEAGAETEMYHLYDLNFKDCRSCFACKLVGNKTNGICTIRDDLREVYEKIEDADELIIGSPIYYSNVTGETQSFINRLLFPTMHYAYDANGNPETVLRKKKKCGLILTMNCRADQMTKYGYDVRFGFLNDTIGRILGSCEVLYSCDTWQFTDYSRYYATMFDPVHKAEHKEKQFPIDLKNAYEMGKKLAA